MEALRDAGYEVSTDKPDAQIIWWDGYIAPEQFSTLKTCQRINKIPMMDVICYKSTFFQALGQIGQLYPKNYDFFPIYFEYTSHKL